VAGHAPQFVPGEYRSATRGIAAHLHQLRDGWQGLFAASGRQRQQIRGFGLDL
jgi:hypothetical protein